MTEKKYIKVRIEDRDILRNISPENLTKYLRLKGWTRERERCIEEVSEIWVLKITPSLSEYILVPCFPKFADYTKRIQETIGVLGEIENRSELLIIQEIMESVVCLVCGNVDSKMIMGIWKEWE
jgi:hypothetical protein